MESSSYCHAPDAEVEIRQLQQQLHLRDQLVDQLSSELFRSMQAHPPMLSAAQGTPIVTAQPAQERSVMATEPPVEDELKQQLRMFEEQIEFYQQQIDQRDAEINRLQTSCQSLSDRNHMLENVIQELPEVYRQKFADRLEQVKNKVQSLQLENQRLQSQLQDSGSRIPTERQGLARRLLPSFKSKTPKKN